MNQKKKIFIFVFSILALIFLGFLVNKEKKVEPKEDLTSTWDTFSFAGKKFSYPPSWQVEKKFNPESKKEPTSIRVFKEVSNGETIEVFIGGDKNCQQLEKKLCLGKIPVYTDSQNPEAMQLFQMFVRVNENPQ